ncbi:MAG: recombinase family protein [Microbacterium sp.]
MGQPSAAIYTRISKDKEGRAVGVKRQEALCRELADKLGFNVVAVFSDNDISASRRSRKPRPGYKALLKGAWDGQYSKVLSYSSSRLTRRPREFEDWIDLFDERRLVVHAVNVSAGHYDLSTAQGRGDARRRAASDAEESDEISERVKAASDDCARRGDWHGGIAPYGYRREVIECTYVDEDTDQERIGHKSVLVIDDAEAAVVREAIERLTIRREPLYSIVKDWNTGPKRTTRKGKHWRHANLRALMMNRALIGENKAGVEAWQPITDPETFDLLQRILKDPARKIVHSPGVKGGKYVLGGGLAVCGRCGGALTSSARNQPNGSKLVKLKCSWLNNGKDPVNHPAVEKTIVVKGQTVTQLHDTGRVSVDHDQLEEYVWEKVIAALSNRDEWNKRITSKQKSIVDPRIKEVAVEIRALKERRARVQEMGEAGAYTPSEAAARVKDLDAAIADAEGRESRLLDVPNLAALPVKPGERIVWRDMAPLQRRNLLRALIERIVVNQWPSGMPSMTLSRKGETREQYEKRVVELRQKAMDARIHIEWR